MESEWLNYISNNSNNFSSVEQNIKARLFLNSVYNRRIYKRKKSNFSTNNTNNYHIQFPTTSISINPIDYQWFLQGQSNGNITLWKFNDKKKNPSFIDYESNDQLMDKRHVTVKEYDTCLCLKWYTIDSGLFFQSSLSGISIWDTSSMSCVYQFPVIENGNSDHIYEFDTLGDQILLNDQIFDLKTMTAQLQLRERKASKYNDINQPNISGTINNETITCKSIYINEHDVATGHIDGMLKIWDIRKPNSPYSKTKIGNGQIKSISCDRDTIWCCYGFNRIVQLWPDSATPTFIKNFKHVGESMAKEIYVTGTAADSDNLDLVFCRHNTGISLYSSKDGKYQMDFESTTSQEHRDGNITTSTLIPSVTCMDFNDSISTLLVGLNDQSIIEWK
ncbi:uncharacterized protein SCODWIG_02298 [Saccharomycodes ludwigii]|uniref:Uncharacterized protein n=1 Tax=Saccharomycodes ludwigii TaxID=36035 RepID=A0A376B759_9ASCO|nr:hypothetical protein SCDLUD_001751 [Saccharomycodes ludwigii]KAH3901965.1 hypothetical protein SCDLUD_001751 [Saccharomycodes ludwigii]SSD60537.1 uncharacterized protein SCODWIG_02298 [Saccharomycodes ludwigii]